MCAHAHKMESTRNLIDEVDRGISTSLKNFVAKSSSTFFEEDASKKWCVPFSLSTEPVPGARRRRGTLSLFLLTLSWIDRVRPGGTGRERILPSSYSTESVPGARRRRGLSLFSSFPAVEFRFIAYFLESWQQGRGISTKLVKLKNLSFQKTLKKGREILNRKARFNQAFIVFGFIG